MTVIERPQNCFWNKDRPVVTPAPALQGEARADVAIIGGGYTGLATAFHLKSAEPALDVAILEAETAGFGASGRNAGFVMTLFGSSVALMKLLHGKERLRDAHHFMERSISSLEAMIGEHQIDCDYERRGFLRVATAPAYLPRLRSELELFHSLGIEGLQWVDAGWIRERVRSPGFLGGFWEPGCGALNPGKWLDALKRLALERDTRLYENSRVTGIARSGGRYRLSTAAGTLVADKIVYATNAYTHQLPGMRFKQVPAYTYVVVTRPLTPAELGEIGWAGREAIEDSRNFMHYFRLTRDNRIIVGGGPGIVPFAGRMVHDTYSHAWDHLTRFIGEVFPHLKGIEGQYKWGGAFSMTPNFTPQIVAIEHGSAVFSLGCTGHGVAMTQMNGQIVRDLILGRKSELTDLWFVNKRSIPMPPEPILSLAVRSVMMSMSADDWWCDRGGIRA